jgi:DNA polymerase-3 subunit beta
MKVIIAQPDFEKALTHVARVVERRNVVEILSHVHITIADEGLTFMATDMDMVLTQKAVGNCETEGALTVKAHPLLEAVRQLPSSEDIALSQDEEGGLLTMTCGGAAFHFNTLKSSDYPQMNEEQFSTRFEIPVADFHHLFDKAHIAMGKEETRYYLNGVYVHMTEGIDGESYLRAAATDGHRLAHIDRLCPEIDGDFNGVIIPRKTVELLKDLLTSYGDETARIYVCETAISVQVGDFCLISKLIDGTYPSTQKLVPDHNKNVMTIDKATFLNGIRRVSVVSDDKTAFVKMKVSDDQLILESNSGVLGQAKDTLVVVYPYEPIEIMFNIHHLLSLISHLEGSQISVVFGDPLAPVILRGDETSDIYVLMPVRE